MGWFDAGDSSRFSIIRGFPSSMISPNMFRFGDEGVGTPVPEGELLLLLDFADDVDDSNDVLGREARLDKACTESSSCTVPC